jgi:RNA processing factor Prp31
MSFVKEALIEEIREAIKRSTDYKEKIDTAKTSIKANTYKKKLKKNNQIVADLVMALDKIDKEDYNPLDND